MARAYDMLAAGLEKLQWTVAGNAYSMLRNADGTRTESVTDTANTESTFASRTTQFDALGRIDWVNTVSDAGIRTYNDLDADGTKAWSQCFQVYDGAATNYIDYRMVPSREWLELGWRSLRVVQPN